MARRIIGIDPGKEGAVALIDTQDRTVLVERLADFSARMLGEWAAPDWRVNTMVVIEKAQARPGQGVSSMFNYGAGYGRLLGWCEALDLPHMLVTPQQWMRVMHVGTTGTDTKARSVEAVRRLFPTIALVVGKARKPHLGLVEALLIAAWGERRDGGVT